MVSTRNRETMTLKEQLLKPLELCAKQSSDDCITDVSFDGIVNESIKIADEFAIGFAEWIHSNAGYAGSGHYVVIGNTSYHTIPKLLEIYKKEKGL